MYSDFRIDPISMCLCISKWSSIDVDNFGQLCDNPQANVLVSDILLVIDMLSFQVGLFQILKQLVDCLNCIIGGCTSLEDSV